MGSRVVYHCQWCLSIRDREKEIETGDRKVNRTWERGSLWKLFRENTKTSLNGILRHVGDDSRFNPPNVGRHAFVIRGILACISEMGPGS